MKKQTVLLVAAGGAAAAFVLYTYYTSKSRAAVIPTVIPNDANIYVLEGGGLEVHISAFGATITKLYAPDRDGKKDDIVLGFESLEPYTEGKSPYFGCIVGRVANRIANALFSLDGKEYNLKANNGPNTLHGGLVGWDKVWWDAEYVDHPEGKALRLTYTSPDGEEGFPGTVRATVTYRLTTSGVSSRMSMGSRGNELPPEQPSLVTEMEATTDQATPISMAQHTYWNLGGHHSGTVLDHVLRLVATAYTPVDANLIPTGEIIPTAGTPFDFANRHKIGALIRSTGDADTYGYDHNYVLSAPKKSKGSNGTRLAASVFEPITGRAMDVLTDAPGVQFYTGNFLDGSIEGKNGVQYEKHAGFCLETQGFPNAINNARFPNVVVRPGETYRHTIVHRFYTR
eukprot:CAMPEP_0198212084 /NCGR_PEP_ID=MMETSP1445-20131203/25514_1 /TAXON_ID=36898 /ORGANISM="Pyramimonas sp., Strain CCMP2087" /LENGTH=398 /DNA_ID=CAMNT_0043886463 /DNA_START=114 /DNA_END=1313 /DNA_ORIENTATION=+